MNWKNEYKALLWISGFFLFAFFLPLEHGVFRQSIYDALALVRWYAREHVLLCLIPAFFIAGTIAVFLNKASVIKYFGAKTKKWISYSVASVSGSVLAVCSCTVLPLFSGIYKQGSGLGPAVAFLYSAPSINILAIILTARVLGMPLGIARAAGAILFAIVTGLIMHHLFRKEEHEKAKTQISIPTEDDARPFWQTAFLFFSLIGILIFATWGEPVRDSGLWALLFTIKWPMVILFSLLLVIALLYILKIRWWHVGTGVLAVILSSTLFPGNTLAVFSTGILALGVILSLNPGEPAQWMAETWGFTRQIMPLLGAGVLIAGFLLGMPGSGGGIIPDHWISSMVGGNSLRANLVASVIGALMYFSTFTEIPILQGLITNGMGQGPALALLLAGPAVSLPNLLVIHTIMGTQKTLTFLLLVIIMATLSGMIFGVF